MKKIVNLSALLALALAASSSAMAGPMAGKQWFQKVDADKSGKIEYAEYQEHRTQMYNAMDKDGNGFLSLEEFMGRAAKLPGGHGKAVRVDRTKRFGRIDASNDKQIGRREWKAETARHFKATDANNDNALSQKEVSSANMK